MAVRVDGNAPFVSFASCSTFCLCMSNLTDAAPDLAGPNVFQQAMPRGGAYLDLLLQSGPVRAGRRPGGQSVSIGPDDLGQLVDFALQLFALYRVPSFQEV